MCLSLVFCILQDQTRLPHAHQMKTSLYASLPEVAVGGKRIGRVFDSKYRQWWLRCDYTSCQDCHGKLLREKKTHLLEYNLGILQDVIGVEIRTVQNTSSCEGSEGHTNTVRDCDLWPQPTDGVLTESNLLMETP